MRFVWKNVTNDELVILANKAHQNKYNYITDDLIILNRDTKLKIFCLKCKNIFKQSIEKHINKKQNCPCYSNKKLTIPDIIKKSKIKHGFNSFNYSKLELLSDNDIKNNQSKIPLICNKGHLFEQKISNHLNGYGCSFCSKTKKLNKADIIIQFQTKHLNKFNYSLIQDKHIKNNKSKIPIICKNHKDPYIFYQNIISHRKGHGCPWCAKQKKISYYDLLNKNFEDYDLTLNQNKTINSKTKLIIICNKHSHPIKFKQTASYYLNGGKCPICFGTKQKLNKIMLNVKSYETFNNNNYQYLTSNINLKDKAQIKCKKHNYIFSQILVNHFNKHQGCKKCFVPSKPEIQWLNHLNIKEENRQISLPGLPNKIKVDGYDPETNTVYEFLGSYFHGDPIKYKLQDYNKKCKASFKELYNKTINREIMIRKAGYNYNFIWEEDWKNI